MEGDSEMPKSPSQMNKWDSSLFNNFGLSEINLWMDVTLENEAENVPVLSFPYRSEVFVCHEMDFKLK